MRKWIQSQTNPVNPRHALRTTLAALLSYFIAEFLQLPGSYWASISALVVMQSEWADSVSISVKRFFGTLLGAIVGALVSSHFPKNPWAFGVAVLLIGLLGSLTRVERAAYRYASITVAIVVLVPQAANPWEHALFRFIEVSLGIGVGLAVSATWPERRRSKP